MISSLLKGDLSYTSTAELIITGPDSTGYLGLCKMWTQNEDIIKPSLGLDLINPQSSFHFIFMVKVKKKTRKTTVLDFFTKNLIINSCMMCVCVSTFCVKLLCPVRQ